VVFSSSNLATADQNPFRREACYCGHCPHAVTEDEKNVA
jgi:hypothetical protein